MPWTADNAFLADPDGETVRTLHKHLGDEAVPPAIVEVRHLGGALSRRPAHPNAVGRRDASFLLVVLVPLAGGSAAGTRAFLGRLFPDLEPWTAGRFLSLMGHGAIAGPSRTRTACTPGGHRRLTALKAVYDPRNTFRLNYNIPPGEGAWRRPRRSRRHLRPRLSESAPPSPPTRCSLATRPCPFPFPGADP
jgi:hypothetical protein